MHAGNGVKDGGEKQDVQMAEMVAVWQLAFWSQSLFWKASAISSEDLLNPSSFFHPLSVIDLIYLDSSENDDDNDEAVTIQRMTVKMLTVKNVLTFPFSMLYILIPCF